MLDIEYAVWVFFAATLHGAIGWVAVDYFTPYPPIYGFFFGLVPDFDVVFMLFNTSLPFVHRGITHTPIFFLTAFITLVILSGDSVVHSFFLGYGLHLAVDAMSGWGIMVMYPLSTEWFLLSYGVNRQMNLVVIVLSMIAIGVWLPPKRRFA